MNGVRGDHAAAAESPRAHLRLEVFGRFFQIPERGHRDLLRQVQQDVEPVDGRPDARELPEVLLHFGDRYMANAPCDDQGPGDVDRVGGNRVSNGHVPASLATRPRPIPQPIEGGIDGDTRAMQFQHVRPGWAYTFGRWSG